MKLKSAAKCRNRRGNILLLCPEVCQGDAANWKELNMRIEWVAAHHHPQRGACLIISSLLKYRLSSVDRSLVQQSQIQNQIEAYPWSHVRCKQCCHPISPKHVAGMCPFYPQPTLPPISRQAPKTL